MEFKKLLNKKFIYLDGAMGTLLLKSGLKLGEIPEVLNITHDKLISDIHLSYVKSGADIIYTNTFGANRLKLKDSGYSVDKIVKAAVKNARTACGKDTLVAQDIGPIGKLLEPTGSLTFEEAYDIFAEQVRAGEDADLIVIETMADIYEAKAAVLAAKENSTRPVLVTMTFEKNMRTYTGCSIMEMVLAIGSLGPDAIGINCSLGPKEIYPLVKELSSLTDLPIIVKPNADLPDLDNNQYNITAEEFSDYIHALVPFGIKFAGGCCGTTPEYIKLIKQKLEKENKVKIKKESFSAVCSHGKTVIIDKSRIIGERINPTGKKLFKEALKNGDIDYILGQAIEQVKAGADILDVNVGMPDIDEKATMVKVVKAVQSVVDVPLQIDSSDPEVLEAALRVYCGKPIVNSVNGEEKSLNTILPLVKKYGAAVVGLTLDENGIPKEADKRFEIAKKILNKAAELGIKKEDVFIDCLTLTVSAEPGSAVITLDALKRVKEELKLNTVLGVSNISFGLPEREKINATFLTMALNAGLTLPIINPNIECMTGSVIAYNLLTGKDENASEFISKYGNNIPAKPEVKQAGCADIFYAIENGLKNEGALIVKNLLLEKDPMEIINEYIIPALDTVGDRYEKGEIFLPQLIMSAEVVKSAFEIIKTRLIKDDKASVDNGKIVLATVKGDIHDIGKNIVKVLLQNYGYKVIDLGKDVEVEAIVQTAKSEKAPLVGLSALMTTTLKSMEETIAMIKNEGLNCKVMVGGAVLTPEYAKKIGADFYAKDAKGAVDISKSVFKR